MAGCPGVRDGMDVLEDGCGGAFCHRIKCSPPGTRITDWTGTAVISPMPGKKIDAAGSRLRIRGGGYGGHTVLSIRGLKEDS